MANRWIDETWWRDWLFWIALTFAVVGLGLALSFSGSERPWYEYVSSTAFSFAFVIAVGGFVRTVVRTYREPTENDDPRRSVPEE